MHDSNDILPVLSQHVDNALGRFSLEHVSTVTTITDASTIYSKPEGAELADIHHVREALGT